MTTPLERLAARLLEAHESAHSRVEWQRTDDADTFLLKLRKGTVRIQQEDNFDDDGDHFYRWTMVVSNRDGLDVESEIEMTYGDYPNGPIGKLWDYARRNALGVEEVIRGIEAEIDGWVEPF